MWTMMRKWLARLWGSVKQLDARSEGDRGNVLLLVALSIVALCGFSAMVSDVGVLYVERQDGQAAADAGALAGADVLVQGANLAAHTAYNMSAQDDTQFDYTAVADSTNNLVTVTGTRTTGLWFGRVLGVNQANLHVHSIARIGTLTQAVGIVPIAVPKQDFSYGEDIYLSDGAGDGSSGNYGFLDFSGTGSKGVETDIEQGYDFPLWVGEQVATEPGVMSGPVSDAIQYRIQEDASDPNCQSFDTARPDCPRVMYLPIIDSLDVNGKKDVTILGFAAFYLEGLVGSGGHQQIEGRFIRMVRPGELGTGSDFGTYAVRLTSN